MSSEHLSDPPPAASGLPMHAPARPAPTQLRAVAARSASSRQPRNNLTPGFAWRIFCNRWPWVLPLGVLLSALAAVIVLVVHVPKYRATSTIRIEAQPVIAFTEGRATVNSDRYEQTQIELLNNPVVLEPALSDSGLAASAEFKHQSDPVAYLSRNLVVEQVGASELYKVSYESRSPDDAATIVNSVIASYLKLKSTLESERAQVVITVLESELEQRRLKVERLRDEVVKLARELTGQDPFQPGVVTDVLALSPAATLYQSLVEAEVSFEVLQAELQSLKDAPRIADDRALSSGVVELEIANRTDVRRLEERQAVLREDILTIRNKRRLKIGDDWKTDPEYLRLQAEAEQVDAELQAIKTKAREEILAAPQAASGAELQQLVEAKEQQLLSLSTRRAMLEKKLQEHIGQRQAGGARTAELEFKKAELRREQNIYEMIAARKLELQTELRAPERVSLIDERARVPLAAVEPIPYKYLLLACLAALFAPWGAVVAYEAALRRITSPEQLTHESSLSVIGEVARLPRRVVAEARRAVPGPPQRDLLVFAESIDSLRTQLMLTEGLGVPGQQRIVAVCSAASGEGKSSLAASLAMSIAEATNQPTLIIDGDLRDPDIAASLGVPRQPGLVELLRGKATLREAVHQLGQTSAFVMPAGRLRGSPHHLFDGAKINNLLQSLRADFNVIIIDTPPVLAASEALLFAQAADLTVVCSLADVSRAKQVRAAVERLQSTGANVAGAVLSGVPVGQYVYNYGTYGREG